MQPQFNIRTLLVWTTISAVILVLAKLANANSIFFWLLVVYGFFLGVYLLFILGNKSGIYAGQAENQAKRERILLDERTKIEPKEFDRDA